MTKDEILKFINENPVFALATIDSSRPRVRYMMTSFADDRGIFFCTGKEKDLCKQLTENPAVELLYCSPDQSMQIRITAIVNPDENLELKKQTVEKFDFLKPWIDREGYNAMTVYILKNPKATTWTMQTNREHKAYIDL